jgi:hypothetical protein
MGFILYVALGLAVALLVFFIFQQKRNNKQLTDQYQILEKKYRHVISRDDLEEPVQRARRKTHKMAISAIPDPNPVEIKYAPKPLPKPAPKPQQEIKLPPAVKTVTKEISERIAGSAPAESSGGLLNPDTVVENWHYVPVDKDVPDSIRERIMDRDHRACRYCGSENDLTITNILPTYRRGIFSEVTLVTTCRSCQKERTDAAVPTNRIETAKLLAS